MRRGIATFTLDYGRCPRWLFERMVRLGREMTEILVDEFGPDKFVERMSDPAWFQSLGTVLAFDWNASGLTTTLTAALKEAIRGRERELGVFICGGKGKTSRKTPSEIQNWGERLALPGGVVSNLVYNSRMAAKVDSSLVQDGFQIYHHAFFFAFSKKKHPERTFDSAQVKSKGVEGFSPSASPVQKQAPHRELCSSTGQALYGASSGLNDDQQVSWAVIQQGMNEERGAARRYHWFSENIKDLVCEPHTAIASERRAHTLNLVAKESESARETSVELVSQSYRELMRDVEILRRHSSRLSQMVAMRHKSGDVLTLLNLEPVEFHRHPVLGEDFSRSRYLEKILARVKEEQPQDYEQLLAIEGVGPKTMRALALVGEVIYGARPSYEDPARYSFAFGGKDATPYPVDRRTYDEAIAILKRAVMKTTLNVAEKQRITHRLGGNKE